MKTSIHEHSNLSWGLRSLLTFILILIACIQAQAKSQSQSQSASQSQSKMQMLELAGLQIGHVASQGNGCPEGSYSFITSPDNSTISILFSNYNVAINPGATTRMVRAVCLFSIPIQVPKGFQLAILGIDYRGFVQIPKSSQLQFKTMDGFVSNGREVKDETKSKSDFSGPFVDNFTISRKKTEINWSQCNERVLLNLSSQLVLKSDSPNEGALASIDSTDIGMGIHYRFALRACGEKANKKSSAHSLRGLQQE